MLSFRDPCVTLSSKGRQKHYCTKFWYIFGYYCLWYLSGWKHVLFLLWNHTIATKMLLMATIIDRLRATSDNFLTWVAYEGDWILKNLNDITTVSSKGMDVRRLNTRHRATFESFLTHRMWGSTDLDLLLLKLCAEVTEVLVHLSDQVLMFLVHLFPGHVFRLK